MIGHSREVRAQNFAMVQVSDDPTDGARTGRNRGLGVAVLHRRKFSWSPVNAIDLTRNPTDVTCIGQSVPNDYGVTHLALVDHARLVKLACES